MAVVLWGLFFVFVLWIARQLVKYRERGLIGIEEKRENALAHIWCFKMYKL